MAEFTSTEIDNNLKRYSISSHEKISPIQWEEVSEFKNKIYLSYHVAVFIDNYLFIHGGIKQPNSMKPTNEFYRIDMQTYQITDLTCKESPYLSQHAAVVLSNKFIVFIGGWDGHSRTSGIDVFNSETLKWLKKPSVTGFPKGAGLSSHTANACLKSNSLHSEIIVIGREGSTRIQRRYGNAYRLNCNKDLSNFVYSELSLNVDSRSGHCTTVINSKLYIIGGRSDKLIDIHYMKSLISDKYCGIISVFVDQNKDIVLQKYPLDGKNKSGRRGHCIIPWSKGFVLTGGASFIGTNYVADPAGFIYVITSSSENFYFLGSISNSRTNGVCAINDRGEAFYHGGIDSVGQIRSEILKLKIMV